MTALLDMRGLKKSFGGLVAVADVDLALDASDLHCLIGPNGAGKSTLFKLIAGQYEPNEGAIVFAGEDVTAARPFERVQRGISIKMQAPSVFKNLPTRQNLHIALQRHCERGAIAREEERLLDLLDLEGDAAKPAGVLSHGQQQWLEIGMALALRPRLMLLDEPTAGMSAEETHRTGELVQRLNAEGMTILVVEHDMAFVRQIARQVTVMHLGRVFARGNIDEIIAHPGVAEIYLGKSHGQ